MERRVGIIDTRSLSEQVYEYLCTRIIEGDITYGESLNIKQIAQALHVSSMPVREAIKRLENEGLVAIKPRSTCMVKEPTRDSILNAIEMREVLEIYCVEKIASGVEARSIEKLKGIIDRMSAVIGDKPSEQELRKYIILDRQFHAEICGLAGNEFVDKSYREVGLHLNMQFIYDIAVPPDTARTYRDHMKLLDALSKKSPKAVEYMKQHLAQSRRNILGGKLFNSLK